MSTVAFLDVASGKRGRGRRRRRIAQERTLQRYSCK